MIAAHLGILPGMAERCGNCGREGTLEHVDTVQVGERPTTITFGDHVEEVANRRLLSVQRCSVCEEPVLSTFWYVDHWSDPSDYMGFKRLFPPEHVLDDLPDRIRHRYGAMLEMLYAPDAFAVRAGRLLEAICADQGVTRGNLGTRLKQLSGEKHGSILPHALAEQADLVRDFRNLGGHDDDVEVEEDDVPLIRDFIESVLEFLYWGPAKLERGRAALRRRLDASPKPDSTAP